MMVEGCVNEAGGVKQKGSDSIVVEMRGFRGGGYPEGHRRPVPAFIKLLWIS